MPACRAVKLAASCSLVVAGRQVKCGCFELQLVKLVSSDDTLGGGSEAYPPFVAAVSHAKALVVSHKQSKAGRLVSLSGVASDDYQIIM